MNDLTYEEKLHILGLSNNKKMLVAIVDSLYDNYLEVHRPIVVLRLLNKMLDEMGNYNNIDKFEDFKILVSDLKKIDGVKFVDDNVHILRNIKVDINEQLEYDLKNKRKNYILVVLKGLINIVGYNIKSFHSKIRIDETTLKTVVKYKIVKK